MSYRGRGSSGSGNRGRGNFRGRGGGRGGYQGGYDSGPPDKVIELGHFVHPCADDLVLKSSQENVPYFNAPIYLENKQQVGKVDEIFGPIKDYFFIDPAKMLPLLRFLPRQPGDKPMRGAGSRDGFKRGGRGGGFSGGRGSFRGGSGFRGGGNGRGGFSRGRGFRGKKF